MAEQFQVLKAEAVVKIRQDLEAAVQEDADQVSLNRALVANDLALAVEAQIVAQAASDAAFINADVYADEATGRGAVANGEQFIVVVGNYLVRYERIDAATSTEVARIATVGLINKLKSQAGSFEGYRTIGGGSQWIVCQADAFGHVSYGVTDQGAFVSTSKKSGGGLSVETGLFVKFISSGDGIAYADSFGHVSSYSDAAVDEELKQRVDVSIDENGNPKTATERAETLSLFRGILARIIGEQSGVARLALVGDSWTFREIYRSLLTKYLAAKFGQSGLGVVALNWRAEASFKFYHARPDGEQVTVVKSAGWTSDQHEAGTLNTGITTSAASGDIFTISGDDATVFDVCKLYHLAGADCRYRWNAGAWSTLDLSAGSVASLSGIPASGAWSLEIEALAAGCLLSMVSFDHSTAPGVRVDALGSGSSDSDNWSTQWATATAQAHIADRAYDAVSIVLGTNDQGRMTAAQYGTYVGDLIDSTRNALSEKVGILVCVPPENEGSRAIPMAEFATAARDVCRNKSVAFLDLQNAFGADPSDYAFSAGIWPDTIHPDETVGGAIIAASINSLITPA